MRTYIQHAAVEVRNLDSKGRCVSPTYIRNWIDIDEMMAYMVVNRVLWHGSTTASVDRMHRSDHRSDGLYLSNRNCIIYAISTTMPNPFASASVRTAAPATASCTATPTDLKNVISSSDWRPGLSPLTISPISASI